MERSAVGFTLVAFFAIVVLGVAASSIHSAPIANGFAISGGEDSGVEANPFSSSGGVEQGGGFSGGGFISSDGSGSVGGSNISLLVLAVLACIAVAGIAVVFWATSGETDPPSSSVSETTDSTASNEQRQTASAPIELTNEVYRAWWEMIQRAELSHLPSRSPAELETAAVEAGLNPDAVAELTRLFRGVRYGGTSITNETERQAAAALARVRARSDAPEPKTGR